MRNGVFKIAILASALLTGGTEAAFAQEIFSFYKGVRQLGMGGAYVAVVNDETAVLTNPAGLGKLRDLTITVADPELSAGFDNAKVATLSNVSKVFAIQDLLDSLNQSRETHWHAKAQFFPSLVTPNFGIGILGKYSYDAEVNADGSLFRLDYTNDFAASTGYCFRFFSGIIKLGVAARLVNRVEVAKDLPATSTGLTLEQIASEGLGLGTDIGLMITAPVAWLPTISGVVRDVGVTSYDLSDGMILTTETRPRDTNSRTDVGFAFFPILANHTRATITAEVHDLTTLGEETDFMRRFHAGAELNIADFFFLRGGLNQRYWTAGLELASERFQLQAATYGEEIGTRPVTREDRRWVGKISIRF